jgi:hypothetical protein
VRSQGDSDGLPFVQVDRSVKQKAAMLAGALDVTPQHALGSLVQWWDLNGEPREIERLVEATPDGESPAVVVTRDDAVMRFRLASGRDVDPLALVHLGFLAPLPDGRFRVRGMSRYIEPVAARLRARRGASKGGQRSAERRREAFGTAQPTTVFAVDDLGEGSETLREGVRGDFERGFGEASGALRSDSEVSRTLEDRGQRTEDRGQRKSASRARATEREPSQAEQVWAMCIAHAAKRGIEIIEAPSPAKLNAVVARLIKPWIANHSTFADGAPDVWEPAVAEDVFDAWMLWLDDPWAITRDPPYAFDAFAHAFARHAESLGWRRA